MFEILSIVFKWLKLIIIITIVAGVLTAGVSLLLPNKYESVVKFLPSNPNLLDKKLYMKEESERPMWLFGGKNDQDRIIELAHSKLLIDYAIERFDLYVHYKIKDGEQKRFKVEETFLKNYKVMRNPYGSLNLEVTDKDPDFASEMANDLIKKIDDIDKTIVQEKKLGIINILAKDVKDREGEIKALIDSIKQINRLGESDTVTTKVLKEILDNKVEDYNFTSTSFNQFKSLLGNEMSSVYIIEAAVPAVMKSSPVRSMLVLSSLIFTFLIMVVVSILVEKYKEYRTEQALA